MTDERSTRIERLNQLKKAGLAPYPAHVERTHTLTEIHNHFSSLEKEQRAVTIIGRIRAKRIHGGSAFLDLEDMSGKIQVFLKKDIVGGNVYQQFIDLIDLGDFLEITGTAYRTKIGEESILVSKWRLVGKTLQGLPSEWYGLSDTEERFRHRELDYLINQESRKAVQLRARVLKTIHEFLDTRGFIEVETPVLQSIPGGANARPFITHHHTLDHDFYLRIAPELYLKRLVVGGFERVYEIARCFRNEGIDRQHNPEFTQVELYHAYADYKHLMDLTEQLFREILAACGKGDVIEFGGHTINFSYPLPRLTYADALAKYNIDISSSNSELTAKLASAGVVVENGWGRGDLLDGCFKHFVRPHLIDPVFLINHPAVLSPLAKRRAENEEETERFQLIIAGMEVVNAFSELNDALLQREIFEEQERLHAAGNEEAQRVDEDFLTALEYGLPPTAGLGLGIDRLVGILANASNLKEVIAFPTLRPK